MKMQWAEFGGSLLQRLTGSGGGSSFETTQPVDDYRMQVQLLRSRNRRLETALVDLLETSEAAVREQRRNEIELRRMLDQSRSDFEVAWSGFTADNALEDQVTSLDLADDRARRWLLTP